MGCLDERMVTVIDFVDGSGVNLKMAIYDVVDVEECKKILRENEGEGIKINNIATMNEYKYKMMY